MADESPLIAGARKVYDTLEKYGATKPAKPPKDTTDYGWHAQKVAEANKSYADAQKAEAKKPTRKRASGK